MGTRKAPQAVLNPAEARGIRLEGPITPAEGIRPDDPITPAEGIRPDDPHARAEGLSQREPITLAEGISQREPTTPAEGITQREPVNLAEGIGPDDPLNPAAARGTSPDGPLNRAVAVRNTAKRHRRAETIVREGDAIQPAAPHLTALNSIGPAAGAILIRAALTRAMVHSAIRVERRSAEAMVRLTLSDLVTRRAGPEGVGPR